MPFEKISLPVRAGAKVSVWSWIRLIFTVLIPQIPTLIRNRPSVADKRVERVSEIYLKLSFLQ